MVLRFMKGWDEAGKNPGKPLEAIDAATDAGQEDASEKKEVTLEYTRNADVLHLACDQADPTNVRVDLVPLVPKQQPAEADLGFVGVNSGARNPNRGKKHL